MAELVINISKIRQNIEYLNEFFRDKNKEWSLITKVFSGDLDFLEKLLFDDILEGVSSVGDSRLTSLKNIKQVNPKIKTIYIKPPASIYASEIVKYADISLNTSLSTIKELNQEAIKQNKVHQIIIMIELGELREGVKREDIIDFYSKIFSLSNIEVIGIGSNLGCMFGIEPNYDKLLQLCLYKELISAKFNKDLNLVSGGTSITLPMLNTDQVPEDLNHYRIGEAVFFGISPLNNEKFKNLNTDTFEFKANIIELEEKQIVPDGVISNANVGHTSDSVDMNNNETSFKAILDFGLLDVNQEDIEPEDSSNEFVGITSDMMVIDLGANKDEKNKVKYKVGDVISFKPNYMAVARLLNSKFIEKTFI